VGAGHDPEGRANCRRNYRNDCRGQRPDGALADGSDNSALPSRPMMRLPPFCRSPANVLARHGRLHVEHLDDRGKAAIAAFLAATPQHV